MPVLPARAPPIDGESLLSLVRRTTQAMGYETTRLIVRLVGNADTAPFRLNELRSGEVCEQLAELLGTRPSELSHFTIHRYAHSLVLTDADGLTPPTCDNGTRLRYFDPQTRICPLCLADSPTPMEKLIWSFRPVPVCLLHRSFLRSACSSCGKRISNARLHNGQCRCGHALDQIRPEPVSNEPVRSLYRIVDALESVAGILPNASAPAGFYWLERIARAIDRCADWKTQLRNEWTLDTGCADETVSWLAAADVFAHWSDRLFEFLDVYIREPKYRQTSTGLSRRLGHLHRQASYLEELGHTGPANAMREYLSRRYSAGHISKKVCLFRKDGSQTQSAFEWTTQTNAAAELQVSVSTVSRLVADGVLQGEIHDAGSNGKSVGVVSLASVNELKERLKTSITLTEAATRLGTDRHRIAELMRSDVLRNAIRLKGSWHIPGQSVEDVLAVISSLQPVRQMRRNDMPLRDATRRFGKLGLTLATTVILIRDGVLRARRTVDSDSLANVIVNQKDVEKCRHDIQQMRDDHKGTPLNRLARSLLPGRPAKERVLKKWIESGLLIAIRSGREWKVERAEIDRFRSTYCLASEACRLLQRDRTTLVRWEADGHITPVYGPHVTPGAGFSLYRRDDIERLRCNWPVRHRRSAPDTSRTRNSHQSKGDQCPTS